MVEKLIRFGVFAELERRKKRRLSARRQRSEFVPKGRLRELGGSRFTVAREAAAKAVAGCRTPKVAMPARETEAIILKTFPLGEADRLVSFFGRESGRLRGVAAGARRIKNRYGSTLELLSHVQMRYVERETRDLVRIQECELLESFHQAQSDYGLSTGFAVISEIAERVLPEQEVAEPMFRLLLLTAREVERRGSWELPLAYFAFWTVKLGGYLPPLGRCTSCGAALGDGPGFYLAQSAGLSCENCRKLGMRALGKRGRALATFFAASRLDEVELSDEAKKPLTELRETALDWVEHHVERRLQTRAFLETT